MTANDEPVAATLSRLRSECEMCGTWSAFTGRTEVHDGKTYAIVRCPRCPDGYNEFTVWNQSREPLVAAFERALADATDPDSYQHAFATLTGQDGGAIAALLASPPPELPLFSIEDVAVPPDAAARWCERVLDWSGWRPLPSRSVRIEEALATALQYRSSACVDVIAARATADEFGAVVDRLERRFDDIEASVLSPLFRAGRRPPGYMTEDLEIRIVSGPPRYASRTDKPVEHVALETHDGELMGYIYINDEDDVAGWQPAAGASPHAQNFVASWMRMLSNAKSRGLVPSAALAELLAATNPNSRIVPDSRRAAPNLDALKTFAGHVPLPPDAR